MTGTWWLALWLSLVPALQAPENGAGDLAAAKALYASGSYEDALTRLATVSAPDLVDEADQYRALCLLALGRTSDTERSLEALIKRRPLYSMSEADVSPRLVTLFRNVRKRLLPDVARAIYTRGKDRFDQKAFAPAAADFRTLQQILADEDLDKSATAITDLALLADGFLRLSEAQLAAAKAATPSQPPAPVAGAATPAPAPEAAGSDTQIYSITDSDVTPPVDEFRGVPAWRPPTPAIAAQEHRGILRIVIDERGRVEAVTLVQPITPSYDPLLISSARQWRFKPALKSGVPVKYSQDIPIVLAPVGR